MEKEIYNPTKYKGIFSEDLECKDLENVEVVIVRDKVGNPVFRIWEEKDGKPIKITDIIRVNTEIKPGSFGHLSFFKGTLAISTAVNIQPAVGIRQTLIGFTHAASSDVATERIMLLAFDGTIRGRIATLETGMDLSRAFHKQTGGWMVTNTDYLRVFNGSTTVVNGYYLCLMEI